MKTLSADFLWYAVSSRIRWIILYEQDGMIIKEVWVCCVPLFYFTKTRKPSTGKLSKRRDLIWWLYRTAYRVNTKNSGLVWIEMFRNCSRFQTSLLVIVLHFRLISCSQSPAQCNENLSRSEWCSITLAQKLCWTKGLLDTVSVLA